jgi:hypothetical protein
LVAWRPRDAGEFSCKTQKQEARPAIVRVRDEGRSSLGVEAGLPSSAQALTIASRWIVKLLIVSTLFFCLAMVRTALAIRARKYRPAGFNFFAIALGFVFQTAFLSVRGHAVGRCPLTNLFEVFIFLAWSVSLIYLLVGPAYRLSLMGAFTSPLVFALQTFALARRSIGRM